MTALAFFLRNWRSIGTAVGLVMMLGGFGVWVAKVKHDAYAAGYSQARAECEDEKSKQEAANQNAINKAASKLDEIEQQLQLKEGELDDQIRANDLAADADPNGSVCGIDLDSVRRLSKF